MRYRSHVAPHGALEQAVEADRDTARRQLRPPLRLARGATPPRRLLHRTKRESVRRRPTVLDLNERILRAEVIVRLATEAEGQAVERFRALSPRRARDVGFAPPSASVCFRYTGRLEPRAGDEAWVVAHASVEFEADGRSEIWVSYQRHGEAVQQGPDAAAQISRLAREAWDEDRDGLRADPGIARHNEVARLLLGVAWPLDVEKALAAWAHLQPAHGLRRSVQTGISHLTRRQSGLRCHS